MHRCGPQRLQLSDLAQIPRGVIGGLIVESAEPARAGTYREPWERDVDLWRAVSDGLRGAVTGQQPRARVEKLPSWVLSPLRARLRYHETYWLGDDFLEIRMLELLGLAQFDPDDDYVLSMLTGLVSAWSWEDNIWGDPVEWFRDDPELIDRAYWRSYEIEGIGVVSLRVNEGNRSGTDWRTATRQMINEGMISRNDVIAACLSALDRDFSSAASQWFVRMLTDLDMAVDELIAMQPAIRRQLRHQTPAVVTNALNSLKRLDRHGSLDDEASAPALEAAVLAPTKVTAMAGLRLLSNIRTRSPAVDVVTAARAGLGHRHVDVQQAAAHLMIAAGATDRLLADADLLEPSVQADLGLGCELGEPPRREDPPATVTASPVGIPQIRPATQHDVTERLAALLEHADDPIELELVLDRLARIGKTDLLRPLAKRARTIVTANVFHRLEQQLAALVLASTGSPVNVPVPKLPWARFLHRRLAEVTRILDETNAPGARLATPTETGGWLDPVEFVQRAGHFDLDASRADLIAALLRLAPDDRTRALRQWRQARADIDPQLDHVVRHALGDDTEPGLEVRDRALWVAASRARVPLGDDRLLIGCGLAGAGQGRGLDAVITLTPNARWRPSRGHEEDKHHVQVTYAYACTPASFSGSTRQSWWTKKKPWDRGQPTATGDLTSDYASRSLDWVDSTWLAWHGFIWPADAEHYASAIILPTYASTRWTSADSTIRDTLTGLRRHPGRIGPTAAATVAIAMNGATADARVHAADTVVDLVGRDRLRVEQLAEAFVALAPIAVLTRWASTLDQIAGAGQPQTVIGLLTRALPGIPRDTHGVHALLDLLHQELLRSQAVVGDHQLRSYLQQFSGSSKAGKSARAMISS